MTATLFDFGAARATDPPPSHAAAATANVTGQRATILGLLARLENVHGTGSLTADDLHRTYPTSDRGTWSTRLSGMDRAGLVERVGYRQTTSRSGQVRKVSAYGLTPAGRDAATRVAHPSQWGES
jgi:DNA-binding HxlR family transcriptional regulator